MFHIRIAYVTYAFMIHTRTCYIHANVTYIPEHTFITTLWITQSLKLRELHECRKCFTNKVLLF